MAILKINNVVMPSPKPEGLTITEEKIWSSNTRRNNKGNTVGTIIAIKTTMDITFPPLTYKEIKKIEKEVSNISKPFVPVYWNDGNGWEFTKTFYFASSPKPIYGTYGGSTKIIGYAISAVQK